jgi:hypothetical protein
LEWFFAAIEWTNPKEEQALEELKIDLLSLYWG